LKKRRRKQDRMKRNNAFRLENPAIIRIGCSNAFKGILVFVSVGGQHVEHVENHRSFFAL
jgi:hypothetical protein